jgi:hypothetical protein
MATKQHRREAGRAAGQQQRAVVLDEREMRTCSPTPTASTHRRGGRRRLRLQHGQPQPPGRPAAAAVQVSDRVIMSYSNVKRLAVSLQQLVRRYEQQFRRLPPSPARARSAEPTPAGHGPGRPSWPLPSSKLRHAPSARGRPPRALPTILGTASTDASMPNAHSTDVPASFARCARCVITADPHGALSRPKLRRLRASVPRAGLHSPPPPPRNSMSRTHTSPTISSTEAPTTAVVEQPDEFRNLDVFGRRSSSTP